MFLALFTSKDLRKSQTSRVLFFLILPNLTCPAFRASNYKNTRRSREINIIFHSTSADNFTDGCFNLLSPLTIGMHGVSVLTMSLKTQLIKCVLCVLLYIAVCSLWLRVKPASYLTRYQVSLFFANYNQTKAHSDSNVPQTNVKRDAVKEESIDLQENAALLQRVKNVCVKYNLKSSLVKRHFLYDPRHRSIYCWIRKVASTSFTKLFADMRNLPPTRQYYKEIDILAPRSLKELQLAANDTKIFKLLVIRHPFQRLVSSYRDRLEDNSKPTAQAWIYTAKIFGLTRPELFRSNTKTGNFQHRVFTPDKRLRIVPSFKEFVKWLLQSSEEDVHWASYHTHCAVCNVSYDYVLKLDNYTAKQIDYVFSKFGLDKSKEYLPKLEETRGGLTNFDTTCKYLANLTRNAVSKLYQRYKIDFEMYDYDIERYMNCANETSANA